jgi:hypothetical protein
MKILTHSSKTLFNQILMLSAVAGLGLGAMTARAGILSTVPMQGGMVMPMVAYHASSGTVTVMLGSTVPQLTPLLVSNPADTFDPTDPWFDCLDPSRQGLAFSRRYGFVMDANTDALPLDTALWIRNLSRSPGLGIYLYRSSEPKAWQPIFGTAGSSPVWQWDGTMFHPGVAAPAGTNDYSAVFEVFLADTATGTEVPGSSSGPLTLHWTTVPDGRPTLDIGLKVAVSWQASTTNYVLEACWNATGTEWTTVTNTPFMVDGQLTVLVQPAETPRFFRMRKNP